MISLPTAPTPCPEGTQTSRRAILTTGHRATIRVSPGDPILVFWDRAVLVTNPQCCSLDEPALKCASHHGSTTFFFSAIRRQRALRSPCSLPRICPNHISFSKETAVKTFYRFNHCQMFFEQNINFSPENINFLL